MQYSLKQESLCFNTRECQYAAMLMVTLSAISWLVGTVGAPNTSGKTLKEVEIKRQGHVVE